MKIGILGSGIVGQTLGARLVEQGHEVILGTRTPHETTDKRGMGESLAAWLARVGDKARVATFADAARHGEVVFNATAGNGSLPALAAAGAEHLRGKILIDVANPLDFSRGMPPTLTICNTDSLGEQIQRAFPDVKVVKALNTVNMQVGVDATQVANGEHDLIICGDDQDAKQHVTRWMHEWFGWKHVIDLGDISNARGTEMLLPLWIRLMMTFGTGAFNLRIVR